MKSFAFLLFCWAALCIKGEGPAELTLTKTIPLPGVAGRFDHFAIDVKGHRLFLAALGNNTLEVVDIEAGKHLKSISGLHKPTGVLYLAEENQIAVANGDDGTFKLFDGASYALVKTISALDDADNMRMDAKAKRIYVGYAEGALAVIDCATMQKIGSIKLAAHPESFQLEAHGNRIFVNVPDRKQVAVIDRDKQAVTATWPMTEFTANFPMALDEENHRLYVGCRQPARLVVFDTSTGKPVTDLAISGDTDDLFCDAQLKRLYVSCGEGFVDVIERRGENAYGLKEKIATRDGARTAFFSPELREFYLAVPARGGSEAELRIFQPPR